MYMTNNWKYLIAIISIMAFIITGCGNLDENNESETNAIEKVITVSSNGSLEAITPSGVFFKAEKNTFAENVNITITESEVTEGLSKYFSNASKLFTISAEKYQITSFGQEFKSKVTNVEKPITIEIPNNIGKEGIYYLGTRANANQDWKYSLINTGNSYYSPMVILSRYSISSNYSPTFVMTTYDVDLQFAIFFATQEQLNSIPKAAITDFTTEVTPSEYELENGCYTDNITIDTKIYGDNIDILKASNYIVEIGFLNNDSSRYNSNTLPIYGAEASYRVSNANAGSGRQYKHTITLSNISDYLSNTLSFGIELKKLSQDIFPADFTITVKLNGNFAILAYEKTQGITLTEKKKEEPEEPKEPEEPEEPEHEITYINIVSTIPANGSENVATDSGNITITFDQELVENTNWADYITVSNGSEAVLLEYEYSNKTLIMKYPNLSENTDYKVFVADGIAGVASYSKTVANAFSFSTKGTSEEQKQAIESYIDIIEVSPANGSIDVGTDSANLITIRFDKDLSLNNDWASFVSLTSSNETIACRVNYADKVMTISHDGLSEKTSYTVFVKAGLKGIEPNTETKSTAFAFMTKKPAKTNITTQMTSPANIDASITPTITIAFSEAIRWSDSSENLVTLSDGQHQVSCNYSYADKTLTITPLDKLLYNTQYTVTVLKHLKTDNFYSEIPEDLQFSFTTVKNYVTPKITGDVTQTVNGRYYLVANHKFTVDFNKAITSAVKAKNSISMQKNADTFNSFTVDFISGQNIATVTVETAFESDTIYKIAVNSFEDTDKTTINSCENSFTSMTGISITSVEIASGSEWLEASGSTDISTSGKIRAQFSCEVEPDAVNLYTADGIKRTTGITNKTSEKSDLIEFDYSNLSYISSYSIVINCSDATTGQELNNSFTFSTGLPTTALALLNPEEPNSQSNPYLICSAKALDQIRDIEYVGLGYYFKQQERYYNYVLGLPFCAYLTDSCGIDYLKNNRYLDNYEITEDEEIYDYIYDADSLRTLSGKKLSNKRNRIHKFEKEVSKWEYKSLGFENRNEIIDFLNIWEKDKKIDNIDESIYGKEMSTKDTLNIEKQGIIDFLNNEKLTEKIKIGGIYIDNKLEAFSIGALNKKENVLVLSEIFSEIVEYSQQYILHDLNMNPNSNMNGPQYPMDSSSQMGMIPSPAPAAGPTPSYNEYPNQ